MTFWFLWLALSPLARAAGACERFFTAAHFPTSYTWTGAPHDDFSDWAAAVANDLAPRVIAGELFGSSLAAVAAERRAFDPATPDVGVPRWIFTDSTWRSRVGGEPLDVLDPRREALVDQIIARHPKLTAPFTTFRAYAFLRHPGRGFPGANVRYEFTERVRNEVITRLHFAETAGRDELILTHPESGLMTLVLRDVGAQVRRMLREGGSKKDFARAVHGYFNALPFSRGSGAIGRIYFTVLHRVLFHENITFVVDVDVRAMTTSPRVFIAQFKRGELIDRDAGQ